MPPGRGHGGMLAIAAAAVAVTGLWLWLGPPLVAQLIGADGGAVAEAVFTVLIFGPLLALALAGAALTGVAAWSPGVKSLSSAGSGAALGLAGLMLAIGFTALAGTLRQSAGGGVSFSLLLGLAVVAVQVAGEEVLFRGWLQPLVARAIGTLGAVLLIAFAFGMLHLLGGGVDVIALLNLMLGGLLFGLLAARDGGIAGAFAAHLAYNAAEQLVVGLDPNPGVGSFGSIMNLDLAGPVRWGGSDTGLNTSWALTIALLALLVPIALRMRRSREESVPNIRTAA